MSDNINNQEGISNNSNKTRKPDFADISFGKNKAVSDKNKSGINGNKNDFPDVNLKKLSSVNKVNQKSDAVSDVKTTAKETSAADKGEAKETKIKKPVSNQEKIEKTIPNLNLKGIKVEALNDKNEKNISKTKKSDLNKPLKTTEALNLKQNKVKNADDAKKTAGDAKEENQKTMVMKDSAMSVKTDKNAYIKADLKANKKKSKNNKSDSGFNNTIFGGFFLAFGIVAIAFIVALGGIFLGREYLGINKAENDITFNIPQGSTSSDIADLLKENKIISNKLLFRVALKFNAPDTIYPGDITLKPSMGYSAIIDELATMREKYETVTISFPEGVTLLEVATQLEEQNVCSADDFLFEFNRNQGFDFEEKISGNDNAFYEMEGYFFPDTYEFYVNDTAYNITKTVREHFSQKFTDKMFERMEKSGLTLNEVMTLASMVQWESGTVEDMPKVASVFLNRWHDLDTFPSFQSDATERYIDKVIKVEADTTEELEHYTEGYDTYNYKGLPYGPICNPGLDAINAVLNPENTDYYYFCNNLKTGEAFFASTLEEHEANLEKAGLT